MAHTAVRPWRRKRYSVPIALRDVEQAASRLCSRALPMKTCHRQLSEVEITSALVLELLHDPLDRACADDHTSLVGKQHVIASLGLSWAAERLTACSGLVTSARAHFMPILVLSCSRTVLQKPHADSGGGSRSPPPLNPWRI